MTSADVPKVLDIQQPGAVLGLAAVFPQDQYPFPRDVIAARWLEEVSTPGIDCLVVLRDDVMVGFAAVRSDEFLHFGVAVECWGTGIAQAAHQALLDRWCAHHVQCAWLRVATANGRGRRFYEKMGWIQIGEPTRSTFAPYPELLRYEQDLTEPE